MTRPVKFNKKAFFSFMTLFIWLILVITGIVLYFSPPGRVAHWIEWRFLGLTKEGWQAVHTIFSFTFIIVGVFHLYFNWVIFWSYLKSRLQAGIKMRRELMFSSLLVVVMLVLIILEMPPFQSVMDIGEYLSNSWSNEQTEPPIPHAELLTLKAYSEKTNRDPVKLFQILKSAGILGIDSTVTIEELAEINGLTPQELIQQANENTDKFPIEFSGYGRMKISDICSTLNIEESIAIYRLKQNKIIYEKNEILKDIAQRNDLKPIEIVKILTEGGQTKPEDAS